jgi:hypothetical protein
MDVGGRELAVSQESALAIRRFATKFEFTALPGPRSMADSVFIGLQHVIARFEYACAGPPFMTAPAPVIDWDEDGERRQARWRSLAGLPPPRRVVLADDRMPPMPRFRLAAEGTALLWRGDFQNARQLLQAMARRIDRKAREGRPRRRDRRRGFHRYRLAQAQRARTLGMLLLPFDADHGIPLRRAPDVRGGLPARRMAPVTEAFVASLRELLGLIGAHEWRKKGLPVPALEARIHPHYGVFAPVRGEYVDLVAQAPLPGGCKPRL